MVVLGITPTKKKPTRLGVGLTRRNLLFEYSVFLRE